MPYTISLSPKAERHLRKLDRADQQRLAPRIRSLADDPHPEGCKKLKGHDSLYRIRVGDFRIIYEIKKNELIVLVVAIRNRSDIYQEVKRR